MEDKYTKIELKLGSSIDMAIKELHAQEFLTCCDFNGIILYSDVDNIESAYMKITGKTVSEFREQRRTQQEAYERELQEHKSKIPELTTEWIEKGNKILDKKYHELWAKIVPVRLSDLYRGFELGSCLDIIKSLNEGCELDKAKIIIEQQGHSGMSFGLVCSMVQSLCDRGEDFVTRCKE